jgi:hypothetical protein
MRRESNQIDRVLHVRTRSKARYEVAPRGHYIECIGMLEFRSFLDLRTPAPPLERP